MRYKDVLLIICLFIGFSYSYHVLSKTDHLSKVVKNESSVLLQKDGFNYEFGTLNKIKNGVWVDAGLIEATKTAYVIPNEDMKYEKGQLQINVFGNKSYVEVGDIYYIEEIRNKKQAPIYEEKEITYSCADEKNLSCVYTEIEKTLVGYKEEEEITYEKRTDYWNKIMKKGEKTVFYVDLKKKPYDSVEVYFKTHDVDIKEHTWWNSDWGMRDKIMLSNPSGSVQYNYSFCINVSINRTYTDVNDFRMSYVNSSDEEEEIGFWRHTDNWVNGSYGGENASGTICFKVPVVATGTNSTTAYLYYNASGKPDKSNISDAFLIGDEFSGSSINTNIWVLRNSSTGGGISTTISGGKIKMNITSSDLNTNVLNMIETKYELPTTNYTVIARIQYPQTQASGGDGGSGSSYAFLAFSFPTTSGCSAPGSPCSMFNISMNAQKGFNSPPSHENQQNDKRAFGITANRAHLVNADSYGLVLSPSSDEIWSFTKNTTHIIGSGYTYVKFSNNTYINLTNNITLPAEYTKNNFSIGVLQYSAGTKTNITVDYVYAKTWANATLTATFSDTQENYILNCDNITSSELYKLNGNITSSGGICINIQAPNITIDCQGYTITGSNTSNSYGIYSNQYNTTIENCNIQNFSTGVYFSGVKNGTIQNNTITTTTDTDWGTNGMGILLASSSDYNKINNSDITSKYGNAIYITSSSNNVINNTKTNSTSGLSIYIYMASNNSIINTNSVSSLNNSISIYDGVNNTINNTNASSTSNYGIYLYNNTNSYIINSTAFSNSNIGLVVAYSSNNNNISFTTARGNSNYSVYVDNSSGNRFYNMSVGNSSSYGFYFSSASNNNYVVMNNITGDKWIVSDATNYFNDSSKGNIYYFTNGTKSWDKYDIIDVEEDGWADIGSSIPFNKTNIPSYFDGSGNPQDFHPFTNKTTSSILSECNITYIYSENQNEISLYNNTAIFYLRPEIIDVNATYHSNNTILYPTKISNTENITFIISAYPPSVQYNSSVNITWEFDVAFNGSIVKYNQSYLIYSNPLKIFVCNSTNTDLIAVYNVYDAINLSSINASVVITYTISNKTKTVEQTNNTIYICKQYDYSSIDTHTYEVYNTTGYNTLIMERPYYTLSNTSVKTFDIYMTGVNDTEYVLITLKDTNYQLLKDYYIALYQFYPSSNNYTLAYIGKTNNNGQVFANIYPRTTQYTIGVFYPNSELAHNFSSSFISFCTSYTSTGQCVYTIYLGTTRVSNYEDIGDAFGGRTNLTGANYCSYSNMTNILNCTWDKDISNPKFIGINLSLRNITNGNMSIITYAYSSSKDVQIVVPSLAGTYLYALVAEYQNTTSGVSIIYSNMIESGSIEIGKVENRFGSDGWVLALVLLLSISFILGYSPFYLVLASGMLIIGVNLIGLITLQYTTIIIILVLMFVLLNWIKD